MEFQLLGPVQAWHRTTAIALGRRRERCLLGILLLEAGSVVPIDRLVDLLWDGVPPASARANVHVHVSRLRQHLQVGAQQARADDTGARQARADDTGARQARADDTGARQARADDTVDLASGIQLVGRGGGYVAEVSPDAVDAHRFRALVVRARNLADPAQRSAQLRAALALWRGPLLADVASDQLRQRIGAELTEARMAAIEQAVQADLDAGRAGDAVVELTGLVHEHPLREGLRAQLMVALYRRGRTAEALELFRDSRALLVEELGIEPGPELQSAHERILARDPSLGAGMTAVAATTRHDPASNDAPDRDRPRNDLPRDVADFAGRDIELLGLLDGLSTEDTAATTVSISAIDGMAGIGKTALAVRAAHRLVARRPVAALFLDLRAHTAGQEPVEPAAALDRMLRSLGVAAERIPAGLDELAALWRAELSSRPVLVVLDNAASAAQVRPLLPGTPGSLVLITSRQRLTDLEAAHHVSLDVLAPADAMDLFTRVAGPERILAEPEHAATVVRLCGYLPLAIRVAAARLRSRPSWTVAHLAERLAEGQRRLAELVTGDLSVAAAFSMSYERLSPDQQRVFRHLGLVPAPDFDDHLVAALTGTEPAAAEQVLEELVDANLVQQTATGRYRLHDLLREHAAALAGTNETEPTRRAATGRVLDYYLAATAAATALTDARGVQIAIHAGDRPPTVPAMADKGEALTWLDTEYASLVASVGFAAEHGWHTYAWQLPYLLQHYFNLRAHMADWLHTHRVALDATRALGDRQAEAHTRRNLGLAFDRVSRHDEAHEQLRLALQAYRAAGDQRGEAATLPAIGSAYFRMGQYQEAVRYCQEAVPLHVATGNRRGEAVALLNIGSAFNYLGRLEESVEHTTRALAVFVEIDDPRGEAMALSNIGAVEEQWGHLEEALRRQLRALDLLLALGDLSIRGGVLTNIGSVLRRLGRYHESIGYHLKAVACVRELGDRTFECEFLNDLGRTRRSAGQLTQALSDHRQALALARELDLTQQQARAHHGIGAALRTTEPDAARGHWQTALDLYDDLHRADAEELAQELHNLDLAQTSPST